MDFIKWNYTGDIDEFDNMIFETSIDFIGTLDSSFFGRIFTLRMVINDYTISS